MKQQIEIGHRFGKVFLSVIKITVRGRTRDAMPISTAEATRIGKELLKAAEKAEKYYSGSSTRNLYQTRTKGRKTR